MKNKIGEIPITRPIMKGDNTYQTVFPPDNVNWALILGESRILAKYGITIGAYVSFVLIAIATNNPASPTPNGLIGFSLTDISNM